jgi:hypothetical protein
MAGYSMLFLSWQGIFFEYRRGLCLEVVLKQSQLPSLCLALRRTVE